MFATLDLQVAMSRRSSPYRRAAMRKRGHQLFGVIPA
jgi:hypothetical protein